MVSSGVLTSQTDYSTSWLLPHSRAFASTPPLTTIISEFSKATLHRPFVGTIEQVLPQMLENSWCVQSEEKQKTSTLSQKSQATSNIIKLIQIIYTYIYIYQIRNKTLQSLKPCEFSWIFIKKIPRLFSSGWAPQRGPFLVFATYVSLRLAWHSSQPLRSASGLRAIPPSQDHNLWQSRAFWMFRIQEPINVQNAHYRAKKC